MYKPGLTAKDLAEMEAACLSPDDFPDVEVEVWPENWSSYLLFSYMRTQWRIGMAGATGLDYGPLHHKMDRMGLPSDEYESLEYDIQNMEVAAINTMCSSRE